MNWFSVLLLLPSLIFIKILSFFYLERVRMSGLHMALFSSAAYIAIAIYFFWHRVFANSF